MTKPTDTEVFRNIYEAENGLLYHHIFGSVTLTIKEIPDNMVMFGSHHIEKQGIMLTLMPKDSDESLTVLLDEAERERLKDKL